MLCCFPPFGQNVARRTWRRYFHTHSRAHVHVHMLTHSCIHTRSYTQWMHIIDPGVRTLSLEHKQERLLVLADLQFVPFFFLNYIGLLTNYSLWNPQEIPSACSMLNVVISEAVILENSQGPWNKQITVVRGGWPPMGMPWCVIKLSVALKGASARACYICPHGEFAHFQEKRAS